MKFTVERSELAKILKMFGRPSKKEDNALLRLEAKGGQIALRTDWCGTAVDAFIIDEGVCFFRYRQFMPLVRTYKGVKKLTVEVTADGIQFGSTFISRGRWEISLFENPDIAPLTLPKPPDAPRDKPAAEQLEFAD